MKKRSLWLVPAALLALAAIVAVVLAIRGGQRQSAADAEIRAAIGRLEAMEAGDPDHVVTVIRAQQRARMEAERDQLREQLLNDELDPYSLLQDYVILGDSRPAGFYYYGFMPRERILADAGYTIRIIPEQLEEIKSLHPARAFLSFGINDINIGFWQSPEEYTAEFVQVLDALSEAVPGIEIYVNSILPVEDWALYKGEAWPRVPEYNEALRQMCQDYGCVYIDNDQIIAEHQDLYDADGIHFMGAFYKYWATNFVLAVYYHDAEEELAQ